MLKVGKAMCFDDILLVPQKSSVSSRHEVDLSMSIGFKNKKINLSLPVIAAPMDTVCDTEMCIAMHNAGGMGILHRYMSYQEQILKSQNLLEKEIRFGVAIASNNGYLAQADHLYNIGVRVFLVDTANGHGTYATKAVAQLRNAFKDAHIMAGNVSTKDGFLRLAEAGADSIRVGIGGGSACTTRLVSGHGVPTLQSIMDCAETFQECSIIADGGIKTSGDMVKSFAAGADAVMIGSMLAGTDEAPGEMLVSADGREVKAFRGMASASAQKDATGKVSVPEGISTTVPYKGSVSHILDQIRGGLGSGCSYTGVEKLSFIEEFSEYVTVSALSVNESIPHAKLS
jgi:IMP dehydrogenase